MRVVNALPELDLEGVVLTVGNFDGVHRGHRQLLARVRELADLHGAPAVVVTFFPPARVVFSDATYLTSEEEKLALLADHRPDAVVVIPFTKEFAGTDKAAFVEQLGRLSPRAIVVGEDFRFGRGRAGSLEDLAPVAGELEAFGLVTYGGEVVKSSRVREHLETGDVASANELLGAPYRATGEVVHGEKRGRLIGYPTANVATGERKALPSGVFAVTVETPQGTFGGMASSGRKPMFPDEPPTLEVNLFGYGGDLYGQKVTVLFHDLLREQRRFGGLEELKHALARDAEDAARALAARGLP